MLDEILGPKVYDPRIRPAGENGTGDWGLGSAKIYSHVGYHKIHRQGIKITYIGGEKTYIGGFKEKLQVSGSKIADGYHLFPYIMMLSSCCHRIKCSMVNECCDVTLQNYLAWICRNAKGHTKTIFSIGPPKPVGSDCSERSNVMGESLCVEYCSVLSD